SPRRDKGSTALIFNPFLKGMKEAGAEVELFYTCDLDINPWRGDLNCMMKTPAKCVQNDDIQMLTPKLGADVLVFASPLYIWTVNGHTPSLKLEVFLIEQLEAGIHTVAIIEDTLILPDLLQRLIDSQSRAVRT